MGIAIALLVTSAVLIWMFARTQKQQDQTNSELQPIPVRVEHRRQKHTRRR